MVETSTFKDTYFRRMFIPLILIIVIFGFLFILITVPIDFDSDAYKPFIGGARRFFKQIE
jgi:hypothetical protein